MEEVIRISNLFKKFAVDRYRVSVFKTLRRRLLNEAVQGDGFFALRDINLKVNRGEMIGLIGHNGAGKSTLLKVLAKLYLPTAGEIVVNGQVNLLSGLGIGMVEELTVRENAFLYGAIYGLDRETIQKNLPEILEWADLQDFEQAKFKTLSSGMRSRLAFSITRYFDADINLFDEALSAGDRRFQDKCDEVFQDYRNGDKTFIFSTHSMTYVKNYCSKTLWLHKGEQMAFDITETVLQQYDEFNSR